MIDGVKITYNNYENYDRIISPIPQSEEGGYARNFEFYLTDHLGNVRVVYQKNKDGKAEIVQENDYYPYGMLMRQTSGSQPPSSNNFLYNGKEQQNFTGYYAYGFRQFDSQIARWHSIDKLAESFQSISPYAYVAGNPVSMVDILGLLPDGGETWIGGVFGTLMRDMPEEQFNQYMQNGGGNWDGTQTANDWMGYEVLLGWTEPDANGQKHPIYGISGAGGYGTRGSFSELTMDKTKPLKMDVAGNYYQTFYSFYNYAGGAKSRRWSLLNNSKEEPIEIGEVRMVGIRFKKDLETGEIYKGDFFDKFMPGHIADNFSIGVSIRGQFAGEFGKAYNINFLLKGKHKGIYLTTTYANSVQGGGLDFSAGVNYTYFNKKDYQIVYSDILGNSETTMVGLIDAASFTRGYDPTGWTSFTISAGLGGGLGVLHLNETTVPGW